VNIARVRYAVTVSRKVGSLLMKSGNNFAQDIVPARKSTEDMIGVQ
jgi:hypothetical protein